MIKNEDWKIYGSFNGVTLFNNSSNTGLTNQSLYINENGKMIKKIRLLCYGMKDLYIVFEDTPYLENKIKEYSIEYKKSGSKYGEIHIPINNSKNDENLDNSIKYLLDVEKTLNCENILELLNIIGINTYTNYWKNQANIIFNEIKNDKYLKQLEDYINNLNYNDQELKNLKLYLVNNLINEDPYKAYLFIEEKDDQVLYNKVLFYQELIKEDNDEKEHLINLIKYGIKAELWKEVKLYFNKLAGKKFGENIDINLKDQTEVILYLAECLYEKN